MYHIFKNLHLKYIKKKYFYVNTILNSPLHIKNPPVKPLRIVVSAVAGQPVDWATADWVSLYGLTDCASRGAAVTMASIVAGAGTSISDDVLSTRIASVSRAQPPKVG